MKLYLFVGDYRRRFEKTEKITQRKETDDEVFAW